MTPHEKQLLEFIRERIDATGIAPTYQEMADHLGLKSKSGAHVRVESLIRQGRLVRRAHASRGIEINRAPLAHVSTAALQAELARREQGAVQ